MCQQSMQRDLNVDSSGRIGAHTATTNYNYYKYSLIYLKFYYN